MSFAFLQTYHPQIVHTPIVLLIFSAFFGILGRLLDRDWLRKTSVMLLVFGFLGAWLAVQSGTAAHKVPEHQQGVPERLIDDHGEKGTWTMYMSLTALVLVIIAGRLKGGLQTAVSLLGLIALILAAVCVGVTAKLGGALVYEHGARVMVDGRLVKSAHADTSRGDADEEREGGGAVRR
jgi:uncharacterized membrane protein